MTRLIPRQDEKASPLTARQETDCSTGIARGVAEYLASLSLDWPEVGLIRFAKSTHVWADYENGSEDYPRAFAGTVDAEGSYDGGLGEDDGIRLDAVGGILPPGGGVVLDSFEELVIQVTVEVHCMNPKQRVGACVMLERAFRPYRGRRGFMLELPHYFNVRASYSASGVTYMDNEEDAARNYRRARFVLQSRAPVVVPRFQRPMRSMIHTSDTLDGPLPVTSPPPTVSR